jgi:DNA-binding CsgD family transcriptional regulator
LAIDYTALLTGLTAREVEVLILIARGISNKQIAQRLVITPKTAPNHVGHI